MPRPAGPNGLEDRPLTPQERAVIERLLSVDFPDVEFFRAQVPAIRVREMCRCGCGTLYFKIDPDAERAPSQGWHEGPDILVEGLGPSWLMLSQDDGWLTKLEHVPNGPNPEDLDAASILAEVWEYDWFTDASRE
jgi:hypothetical protein